MRLLASFPSILLLTACQTSGMAVYNMKSCVDGTKQWSELTEPPQLRESFLKIDTKQGNLRNQLEVDNPKRLEKWYVNEDGNYLACTFLNTHRTCMQSTIVAEIAQEGTDWKSTGVMTEICVG